MGREPLETMKNIEPQQSRHAVDLLPHRARITIDVDVSQLPVRFRLNRIPLWADHSRLATPAASTTASVPLPP
jgi:hypothetical protein